MHETFFFICGGILAASAVLVSIFGLKNEHFPGKWMPLVVVWFAVFAVGTGTFAVLHGKDESKDHDKEYSKANKEIELNEGEGPFLKAQEEAAKETEAAGGKESAGGEGGEAEEGEATTEGGESEAGGEGGGNAQAGTVVFSENCAVCHGATGNGGNGGPDLTTMPLAKTEAGVIQQATNGGGGMPPFGGTLSEEEIKNVAAYVVQEITHGK